MANALPSFTTSYGPAGTPTAIFSLVYFPAVGPPTSTELAGEVALTASRSSAPSPTSASISSVELPSFTTISNLDAGGSVTAIRTLFYIPATDPTKTETGGLVTALGDSTPSSTSASISASSDVGSGSISSVSGTTTASAAPTSPSPKSTTGDDSTPIIYTPSSSSLSSSLSTFTSSNPTKPAIGGTPVPPPQSNRLANGTVAGIVIGVAIGLALITFLATLLAIRRRRGYVHVPSAKEFYKGLREKWGRWLSRQDESFEPDYTVQNKVEKDVAVRTIMEAERLGDMKVVCG